MAFVRRVGGVIFGLAGAGLIVLALGTVIASLSAANSAWVLGVLLLPPVPLFLALARGFWGGRPVRATAGLWTAVAALGYSAIVLVATVWIARGVAQSPSWLAGTAFVVVLPLWPLVLALLLIARGLLQQAAPRPARAIFLAASLSWVLAWAGFWAFMLPSGGTPAAGGPRGLAPPAPFPSPSAWSQLVATPEAWIAHAFFLLPALVAAMAGWTLPRRR